MKSEKVTNENPSLLDQLVSFGESIVNMLGHVEEKKGVTVKGQVVSKIDGRNIINMDLEIRGLFDLKVVANTRTNSKGEFEFIYDGVLPIHEFKAHVLAPKSGVYGFEKTRRVFDTFTIQTNKEYYKQVFKTPFEVDVMEAAVVKTEGGKYTPIATPARFIFKAQHVPCLEDGKFLFTLGKGALPDIAKFAETKAKELFEKVSTDEIQQIFNPTKEAPRHTAETLVNLLLRFTDPHLFIKKPNSDGKEFTYDVDLSTFKKRDDFKGIGLPERLTIDLAIKKKDGKEYLDVSRIIFSHPKLCEKPVTYTPESNNWKEGIAHACDTLFTLGEADSHLIRGHLIPGYLAFLVARNFLLKDNPLSVLFAAFIKGIMRINFLGATAIFSAKLGAFAPTNLPQEGLNSLLTYFFKQTSNVAEPRPPLGEFDQLGKVKEILFKIASKAKVFLEEHKKTIMSSPEFINEIWTAAEDMRRYGFKRDKISKEEKSSWVDDSELKGAGQTEDEYVFEPIMTKEGVFGDTEWEKLKSFSTTSIYHVLRHHIIHILQEIFAAFPNIYSLSGRAEGKNIDDDQGVNPDDAMSQLIFKNVLINFEKDVEPLITNEDIPKIFRDTLRSFIEELKALCVDALKMSSSVEF